MILVVDVYCIKKVQTYTSCIYKKFDALRRIYWDVEIRATDAVERLTAESDPMERRSNTIVRIFMISKTLATI